MWLPGSTTPSSSSTNFSFPAAGVREQQPGGYESTVQSARRSRYCTKPGLALAWRPPAGRVRRYTRLCEIPLSVCVVPPSLRIRAVDSYTAMPARRWNACRFPVWQLGPGSSLSWGSLSGPPDSIFPSSLPEIVGVDSTAGVSRQGRSSRSPPNFSNRARTCSGVRLHMYPGTSGPVHAGRRKDRPAGCANRSALSLQCWA